METFFIFLKYNANILYRRGWQAEPQQGNELQSGQTWTVAYM